MRQRYYYSWCRHPRTRQEIKANLDKFDTCIRGKRRNLPNAWDDLFVRRQKSWKYSKRKHQYRELSIWEKYDFGWHHYHYKWHERHSVDKIRYELEKGGYYYEYIHNGIVWYGPSFKNPFKWRDK